MRIPSIFLLILITLVGHAQVEQDFLHSKGYLVKGMATLELESNRTGWWRLSPPIAARYGLEMSSSYDGRKDPIRSTRAAAEWWSFLFDQFDDSLLADYAFVYGPSSAVILSNNAINYVEWKRKVEEWYGQKMDSLPNYPTYEMEMAGSLYWEDLKESLGWSESDYRRWKSVNPGLSGEHLATDEIALVRLESVPNSDLMEHLWERAADRDSISLHELTAARKRIANNIPDPSTHNRVVYRVRSGDVLGSISQRYRVSLADVKKWNNLRSDVIRIGQELVLYVPRGIEVAAVSPSSAEQRDGEVRSDEENREEVQYSVKTGDTLWSIARKYPGVSADDIMRWNGIDEDIREGQVIMILAPNRSNP